jgi:aromatic-L-amino-acid decarboxylase
MKKRDNYHMSTAEFRMHGHALVDWVANYLDTVEDQPVLSQCDPGAIRSLIPEHAPEDGEEFTDIMADLDRVVMPGLTHWQSPNWFSYFPANSSPVSVLGELASAGLASQGMLWSTSPAVTEVECAVLDWLVDLLGLPKSWKMTGPGGGVIQMSASDSTHTALVVARERCNAPIDLQVVYTSNQAHSSIEKGVRIAGIKELRLIDVDDRFAMDSVAFETVVLRDLDNGLTPSAVVSTIGTTGTTAVDPVERISSIARKHGLWHHVDAAYAGTAMICPEFRYLQDGLNKVDSYTFNPHKWMFTNFDCNVFWVADRKPLIETMTIVPPYLRDKASESGSVVDYRDWHVSLGRRFRSLKLWWVLRSYGAAGIRYHVREHVRLARDFEARILGDSRFALVAPTLFSLVSFRHISGEKATIDLAVAINATGKAMVTSSIINEQSFIRVSIGQTRTEQNHVDALWSIIDAHAIRR